MLSVRYDIYIYVIRRLKVKTVVVILDEKWLNNGTFRTFIVNTRFIGSQSVVFEVAGNSTELRKVIKNTAAAGEAAAVCAFVQ